MLNRVLHFFRPKLREATRENNLSGRYILALKSGHGNDDSIAAQIIRKNAKKLERRRKGLKVKDNVVEMKRRKA